MKRTFMLLVAVDFPNTELKKFLLVQKIGEVVLLFCGWWYTRKRWALWIQSL